MRQPLVPSLLCAALCACAPTERAADIARPQKSDIAPLLTLESPPAPVPAPADYDDYCRRYASVDGSCALPVPVADSDRLAI